MWLEVEITESQPTWLDLMPSQSGGSGSFASTPALSGGSSRTPSSSGGFYRGSSGGSSIVELVSLLLWSVTPVIFTPVSDITRMKQVS